ncbi:MAG: iron-sulfur cluster assembly accessory protein [Acidimicrobiia bacterium]|nr:iron-sulfur cluster assembly accessory protein [Acidimicrobiia bacterium]
MPRLVHHSPWSCYRVCIPAKPAGRLRLVHRAEFTRPSREKLVITLTDAATSKVGALVLQEQADNEDLALRVAVRPGGCSGFSYEMYFDADVGAEDQEVLFGEVKVVVDSSSAALLEGAVLDYKDGLTEAGFSITNPNAQRTCGCGQSFS